MKSSKNLKRVKKSVFTAWAKKTDMTEIENYGDRWQLANYFNRRPCGLIAEIVKDGNRRYFYIDKAELETFSLTEAMRG